MTARPRATLADWTALTVRGEVVELIDGEIVPQSMGRAEHGRPQLKLGALLDPFNRRSGGPKGPGGWWLMTEVDVLYPKTEEVFRHDVLGFRRDRHETPPTGHPLRIVPDWACEILSPSTARYDVVKKRRTLHAHAVPHYWIIDPANETVTVLRYQADGYLHAASAGVGDVTSLEPFEAIEIDVAALFGRDE